jgi:hypothetical protein
VQFVKRIAIIAMTLELVACGSTDLSQLRVLFPTRNTYPSQTGTITLPPSSSPNANAPDMLAYRIQVAKKIMQANGSEVFAGDLPDPLASIPVIEISLNADGSIRGLDVIRTPHFHPETVQMAMVAIRRSAPFSPVAHLPQPWVFNETFLFNDGLKFQLHSLQP